MLGEEQGGGGLRHAHAHAHAHAHVTCYMYAQAHVTCYMFAQAQVTFCMHMSCTCACDTCTWRYTLYNLYNPPLEGKGLGALPRALTLRASRIHSYSYTPPGPRDCAWSRRAAGERARDVPLALLSFPNHDEIFRQMQLAHGVRSHPKYAL
jgi:hypothetical protein